MFAEISIFVGSQRVSTAIQWLGPAWECLAITAEVFLKAGKWKLMSSDLIQMPWAAEGGPPTTKWAPHRSKLHGLQSAKE